MCLWRLEGDPSVQVFFRGKARGLGPLEVLGFAMYFVLFATHFPLPFDFPRTTMLTDTTIFTLKEMANATAVLKSVDTVSSVSELVSGRLCFEIFSC